MRGTTTIKKGKTCDPQSAVWMGITIFVFPFIALIADLYGFHPAVSFGLGAIASIIILVIELITRKRVWFFDPCIKEWIEHPLLAHRLIGFLGIVLLLFLSFLMVGFLMNPALDQNVMRFILNRQCSNPQTRWMASVCRIPEIEPERATDPVSAAIRTEAAKRMYPESSLVTCAQKTINQTRDEVTVIRSAIIRCDQWVIGTLMQKPVSFQSTQALIMVKLIVQQDGSYLVQEWSEDSSSDAWSIIGEEIASSTLVKYNHIIDTKQIQQDLADETAQRANLFLSRN